MSNKGVNRPIRNMFFDASRATADGNPLYGPAIRPSLFAMFLITSNEPLPQVFFPGNCCNVFALSIGFVQHTASADATHAFGMDVHRGSLIFCKGALRRVFTLALFSPFGGELFFRVAAMFLLPIRGSALDEDTFSDLADMSILPLSPSLALSPSPSPPDV